MIDDTNPIEEDVTKLDLLKRVNELRDVIESAKGEFNYRIDTVKPSLLGEVEKSVSTGLMAMDQRLRQQEAIINGLVKDIRDALLKNSQESDKKLEAHTESLDLKIKGLSDGLEHLVKVRCADYLAEITRNSGQLLTQMAQFSEELTAQINKFQTDMKNSAGLLDSKFENVMGRFRAIFKDL